MITLKTLPQATEQEVFDQVATHLLTQNERSEESPTMGCRYVSNNSSGKILKCAAGCLIADEEYHRFFESLRWGKLIEDGHVSGKHAGLINALQNIHDFRPVSQWKQWLHDLAKQHNLDFTSIQQF